MRTLVLMLLLAACTPRAIREAHVEAQASPDDPAAWVALGDALSRARRAEQATRAYAQALALDPENEAAKRGQAQLSGVAWRLERRARNNPMDDEIWGDLADRYAELGMEDQAIAAYRYAHQLDPEDSEWIGALQTRGVYEGPTTPDGEVMVDDEALGDQGDAYREMGNWQTACTRYREALALDPGDSEWVRWTSVCASFGDEIPSGPMAPSDLSEATLPELRQRLDDDLELLVALGEAHANAGDEDDARRYLRGALLLRPDHRPALHALLRLDGGSAVDVLHRLAEDSNTPAAWNALATVRLEAGDAEGAAQATEKARALDADAEP